jgi:hypothetical protein
MKCGKRSKERLAMSCAHLLCAPKQSSPRGYRAWGQVQLKLVFVSRGSSITFKVTSATVTIRGFVESGCRFACAEQAAWSRGHRRSQ